MIYMMGPDGERIPPPRPNPPPPQASYQPDMQGLSGAVHTAVKADGKITSESDTAAINTANVDWGAVYEYAADAYRRAEQSNDPKAAVASLDQTLKSQAPSGVNGTVYKTVIKNARTEVVGTPASAGKAAKPGESSAVQSAQIGLFSAENAYEAAGTPANGSAVLSAEIQVQLATANPTVTDGVYSPSQIAKAVSAVQAQNDPKLSGVIEYSGFTTLYNELPDLKLTPAEQQLYSADPISLTLLMLDGVPLQGALSPQMLQLAQKNSSLFTYLQLSGMNISISPDASPGATATDRGYLSPGKYLVVTVTGKDGKTEPYKPSANGPTLNDLAAVYLSGGATGGLNGVADELLGSSGINLNSLPANSPLLSLISAADSFRVQSAGAQFQTLVSEAPPAGSSSAAQSYVENVLNPYLTQQLNGFLTSGDPDSGRAQFWSEVTSGGGALPSYIQKVLLSGGSQGGTPTADYTGLMHTVLQNASPEEAQGVITTMMATLDKSSTIQQEQGQALDLSGDMLAEFNTAAQLADQAPGVALNPVTVNGQQVEVGPWATKVANWILTPDSGGSFMANMDAPAHVASDITSGHNADLGAALFQGLNEPGVAKPYIGQFVTDMKTSIGSAVRQNAQAQAGGMNAAQYADFQKYTSLYLDSRFNAFSKSSTIGVTLQAVNDPALRNAIGQALGYAPNQNKGGNSNTVDFYGANTQQGKVIALDVSWILNQAGPGGTVVILPYLFASSQDGVQDGVFFETHTQPSDNKGSQTASVPSGPASRFAAPETNNTDSSTTSWIDGLAAVPALQLNPNANQHPDSVDVKWHYSSFSDFQLNNDLYQGGSIYMLANNRVTVGADGNVDLVQQSSSRSDAWKDFTKTMDVVAGVSGIVGGLLLAPFTGGGSTVLTVAGVALLGTSVAWSATEDGIQADDMVSHGEHYGWSNPNAHQAIEGDVMTAVQPATLTMGGISEALTTADDATGMAATMRNFSALGLSGLEKGVGTVAAVYGAAEGVNGAVNLAENWGSESWTQRTGNILNVGINFAAIATVPLQRAQVEAVVKSNEGAKTSAGDPETEGTGSGNQGSSNTPSVTQPDVAGVTTEETAAGPQTEAGGGRGPGGPPGELPPGPPAGETPDEAGDGDGEGGNGQHGSVFDPAISQNDFADTVFNMPLSQLEEQAPEAAHIVALFDALFLGDPDSASQQFQGTTESMRRAFENDDLPTLEVFGAKAQYLLEILNERRAAEPVGSESPAENATVTAAVPATAPEAVPAVGPETVAATAPEAVPAVAPESVATAPEAVSTTAPEAAPTAATQAAPTTAPEAVPTTAPQAAPTAVPDVSLTAATEGGETSPTEPSQRFQHTRDLLKHYLHLRYYARTAGRAKSTAQEMGDRFFRGRTPRGTYETLTDAQARLGAKAPQPLDGVPVVKSAEALNVPIESQLPLGTERLIRVGLGKDAKLVEESVRTELSSPAGQKVRYLAGENEFTPTRGAQPGDSYLNSKLEGNASVEVASDLSVEQGVWTQETLDLINAVKAEGLRSPDRDVVAAVEYFQSLPEQPELGQPFTDQQRAALGAWLEADVNSRLTGAKPEGTLSANASATLDRLFDQTAFKDDGLLDAAMNTHQAVFGQDAPLTALGEERPQVGVALTGKQSSNFGETMLRAWEQLPDDPDGADRATLTALLGSTSLEGDDWQALNTLAETASTSPDAVLADAGKEALQALKGLKHSKSLTPELMDSVVPLLVADRDSSWIGGSVIRPSVKDVLSPRGEALQEKLPFSLIESATGTGNTEHTWGSPETWEAARTYAVRKSSRLRGSRDPDVRAAAKAARKALPSVLPRQDSLISVKAQNALTDLINADRTSWHRQRDPDFDDGVTYRPNRGLVARYLAVTQHPGNILANILLKLLPAAYSWAGPTTYQATLDFSLKVNIDDTVRQVGFDGNPKLPANADFRFAVPIDPNNLGAGFRPNLFKVSDDEYIIGADLYAKIIAQRVNRLALPISKLVIPVVSLVGVKPRLEVEVARIQNLYNYYDEGAGKVRPGYTRFPAGTRLTAVQVRQLELAFKYGTSPFYRGGEVDDIWIGLSQTIAPWSGAFNHEYWRRALFGSIMPREEVEGTRSVMNRRGILAVASLELEIPGAEVVRRLSGVKPPSFNFATVALEGMFKYVSPRESKGISRGAIEGPGGSSPDPSGGTGGGGSPDASGNSQGGTSPGAVGGSSKGSSPGAVASTSEVSIKRRIGEAAGITTVSALLGWTIYEAERNRLHSLFGGGPATHPSPGVSPTATSSGSATPSAPSGPASGGEGTHPKKTAPSKGKEPTDQQYVVLPGDGLNVRAEPSSTAHQTGEFNEGTFVQSTGTQAADSNGNRWMFVTGPGASGWVEGQYLRLHPEGAEGPTGREDPTLAREGYRSVTVFDNESLGQIAEDNGLSPKSVEGLDERYLLNPSQIYPGDQIYLPESG